MAIVRKGFRCGITADYNNSDKFESRVEELGHINSSLEFWIFNNANTLDNALVIGAGFGLNTKQLIENDVTVTSLEPNDSRFSLLEANAPTGTNINKAAGSSSGTSDLVYFENNQSRGALDKTMGNASESVEVVTVDSLGLSPDILFINTNGTEVDVLRGATDTIANNPDMKIWIRWDTDLLEDVTSDIEYLNSLGKTIKLVHWEKVGDAISYKETSDTILEAVITADLLLE